MREAMMKAGVGDDVFGEDPSVNELEAMTADMFGMEAALFCPSGTMTNQIAIKCHTRPGDEVICDHQSHVYIYEAGGIAANSGSQVKPVIGDRGRLHADQVIEAISPDDVHKPRTSLVSLENTANRGGGSCYQIAEIERIKNVCLNKNLKLHLDGARLWNALVARGESARDYGVLFDSISVCLSKGLGAPVGSLLLGNHGLIKQARRVRKLFGGGMRQAGFLAAAGIYALQHHIDRIREDHNHCQMLAEVLSSKDFVISILPVETNILIAEIGGRYQATDFVEYLKERDILCLAISPTQIRMITHLDVSPDMIRQLCKIIQSM